MEYEICKHCDHFVDRNEVQGEGIAPFVHLDDGEKEHDHDAEPSGIKFTLREWKSQRKDLFRLYADGKIGPNSLLHAKGGTHENPHP